MMKGTLWTCMLASTFIANSICQLQSDDSCSAVSQSISDECRNNDMFPADNLPIIIWWYPNLFPHFDKHGNTIHAEVMSVASGSCIVTNLREYQHDPRTAAFIFYGTDFKVHDVPLPTSADVQWALLHEESPLNNYIFSHGYGIRLFNITATFSRFSDYPLTSQFIGSKNYLLKPAKYSVVDKNELMVDEGLAPVLYLQSHCGVASDRDRYVKHLMRYIQVDSYGECLHNKDLPASIQNVSTFLDEELLQFISKYKFHLTFENAICKDYISEKVFRTLHVGSVPIYLGSPTVNDWMPNNHTLLHVNDFNSPKDLAAFVEYLNTHDAEYNKYLSYKNYETWTNPMLVDHLEKREWSVNTVGELDFIQGFDRFVCSKVLEVAARSDDGGSEIVPVVANSSHMGCPQPYVSVDSDGAVDVSDIDADWDYYDWVNVYWGELDKAKALHKLISMGVNDSSKIYDYI